jgi:chaperonin cofactor prefoldin
MAKSWNSMSTDEKIDSLQKELKKTSELLEHVIKTAQNNFDVLNGRIATLENRIKTG